jgi:hypothetical protein
MIFLLTIFSGCVTKEAVKNVSDEEVLRERVIAYWNHKIREEFDKSYEYEYPLYRKQVSLVKYIKGFKTDVIRWKAVNVKDININDDEAIVGMYINIDVKVPGIRRIERDSLVKEKWVRVEGIWYHVPERAAGRKD